MGVYASIVSLSGRMARSYQSSRLVGEGAKHMFATVIVIVAGLFAIPVRVIEMRWAWSPQEREREREMDE
jgi:hypothetical protein